MKKAIVTLIVGKRYKANFNKYCQSLWSLYAKKHGFDLIVIDDYLDNSPRAQSRSVAWQKCLILSHPDVQKYDQVVWVDSDIMINPCSPDICANVPIEKIGVVDEYASPSREEHSSYRERVHDYWSRQNIKFLSSLNATQFHQDFGLEGNFESIVQTGTMVLSPVHHQKLLEHVYYDYEDKGKAYYNYEMRPLSYEILKNDLAFWLDPKFNQLWILLKQFHYPFLESHHNSMNKAAIKVLKKINLARVALNKKCVTTAFMNNYFLHFAATSYDMRYVNTKYSSVFEIN